MKKLIAGLIIVLLLGGIFGFAPSMAYADPGGSTNNGVPIPPASGRTDGGGVASPTGGVPIPPASGR
jgi:hypothetical protein